MLWPHVYPSVCLSLCLSVTHKPAFCRNSSMQRAGFRHRDYPGLILNYIIKELGYLKNEGSFSNSEHSRFFMLFATARRQSRVVNLVRPSHV